MLPYSVQSIACAWGKVVPHVSCRSPQVRCASGAPDHVGDDEVPIPCHHVTCVPPLGLLPMLLLPRLPTVMMTLPFRITHTVLLWFRIRVIVMVRFLSYVHVFLAFTSPSPLVMFALNLPRRLAAAAFSGMIIADLLLLHLSLFSSALFGLFAYFLMPFRFLALAIELLTPLTGHALSTRDIPYHSWGDNSTLDARATTHLSCSKFAK
jgi:hypothetical protein